MNISVDLIWVGLKWVYLLAFGLYVGFSVVIVSQTQQMTKTLSGGVDKHVILISWLHLILSLLALVWAVVVL